MKVKRSKEDKSKYNKFKVKTTKKKRLKYGQEYVNNYAEMLEDMEKKK
jgi:hypothetical protein